LASFIYNLFKQYVLDNTANGRIDWDTDTVKVALVTSAYTPNLMVLSRKLFSGWPIVVHEKFPADLAYHIAGVLEKIRAALLGGSVLDGHAPGLAGHALQAYASTGIRSNSVCPAWVRTDMGDAMMDELGEQHGIDREEAYRWANRFTPARRPATLDEVAGTVVFLASPDAGYVNGTAIPIDGGATSVNVGLLWDIQ